jgi:hypothetical protein
MEIAFLTMKSSETKYTASLRVCPHSQLCAKMQIITNTDFLEKEKVSSYYGGTIILLIRVK